MNSMTGYGRGEKTDGKTSCLVEVRSVNHRFMEVVIKSLRRGNAQDEALRKKIKDRFSRGYFEVSISFGETAEKKTAMLDLGFVEQVVGAVKAVQERFGISGELDVNTLVQQKEFFRTEDDNDHLQTYWPLVEAGLEDALNELGRMREVEGGAIGADMKNRLDRILSLSLEIEKVQPEIHRENFRKMKDKIGKLIEGKEMDESRLIQEAALVAERSDVTEEIVRIRSHLGQMAELLGSDVPVGRKMEFILQEINREINTVGAKGNDLRVSKNVIEVKSELEKIREQIQNVE